MKEIFFTLAQANSKQSVVTSEPVGAEQTTSITKADSNSPKSVPSTPRPSNMNLWIMLGLMILVFYFIIFRGPRKQQQQHRQMVQSLKKNDRVRTIGGILGTVVDINDDEITLKIDESTNTKIKVSSSAIGKNLSDNK